jgi:hypothetical protein
MPEPTLKWSEQHGTPVPKKPTSGDPPANDPHQGEYLKEFTVDQRDGPIKTYQWVPDPKIVDSYDPKSSTTPDTPDTSDTKLSGVQKDQLSTQALGSAEAAAMAPLMGQLANLPQEYSGTISSIMAGNPTAVADAAYNKGAETSTGYANLDAAEAKGFSAPQGNAALNASDNALTQSILAGSNSVESALSGLPAAEEKAIQSAPYSDILSTLLTQKKNEILYGEVGIPQTANTTGWSNALKDVYDYIQGSGSTSISGSSGADILPGGQSLAAAASSAVNNTTPNYTGSSSSPAA